MGLTLPLVLRPTDAMIILHTCAGTLVTTAADTDGSPIDDINQHDDGNQNHHGSPLLEASWGSPQEKSVFVFAGPPHKRASPQKQNTFLSGKKGPRLDQ
jgi:hypothetical protein